MMSYIFRSPDWIKNVLVKFSSFDQVPQEVFDDINKDLDLRIAEYPEVSIIIPAYNEEQNILSCIKSLSLLDTAISYEIIVINNNSTDSTQDILNKLNIISLFENKIGPGAARQLGLEKSKGKFILSADADCLYPKTWLSEMYNYLNKPNVACVYGRYSFIESENVSRSSLFAFELAKDIFSEIRHINRPHFNSLGMNMGFPKALGLKVGYDTRNVVESDGTVSFVRGEDGRLCFDLSEYGKIIQVRSRKARLWTGQRTLEQSGSMGKALLIRVKKELLRLKDYSKKHAPHDTKNSEN